MTADGRQRAAGRIRQLARRGLDVAAFWRECNEVLGTAVPHHLAPCLFTFDPASLLITSHYDPVIPEISAEFLAHEYRNDDVLKMFVSPQTVQQHLKSIFGKTGVRSRRELVSQVFFAHYEPRLRRSAADLGWRPGRVYFLTLLEPSRGQPVSGPYRQVGQSLPP